MTAQGVLVCTACGSPACITGESMCFDAIRADAEYCSCEWPVNALGDAGAATPSMVDPSCWIHGEPS